MIAKVVTHQKALQTLGTLSVSSSLLGNLSQTLLKSVRNQIKYQLIMGYRHRESSTRVLELQRYGSCRFGDLCRVHWVQDGVVDASHLNMIKKLPGPKDKLKSPVAAVAHIPDPQSEDEYYSEDLEPAVDLDSQGCIVHPVTTNLAYFL
jgi:hypothetical protein